MKIGDHNQPKLLDGNSTTRLTEFRVPDATDIPITSIVCCMYYTYSIPRQIEGQLPDSNTIPWLQRPPTSSCRGNDGQGPRNWVGNIRMKMRPRPANSIGSVSAYVDKTPKWPQQLRPPRPPWR